MSQLGQQRRFSDVRVTSALPLKADIHREGRHVRLVPTADMTPRQREPATTGLAASSSRGSFERLDKRLGRERLGEIGEAPGLKRRLANGRAVVPGHVDDRHSLPRRFETVPQLDP